MKKVVFNDLSVPLKVVVVFGYVLLVVYFTFFLVGVVIGWFS